MLFERDDVCRANNNRLGRNGKLRNAVTGVTQNPHSVNVHVRMSFHIARFCDTDLLFFFESASHVADSYD